MSSAPPPPDQTPISAVPSHVINGSSSLRPSSSAASASARERDSLNASIRASFRGSVDLSAETDHHTGNQNAVVPVHADSVTRPSRYVSSLSLLRPCKKK